MPLFYFDVRDDDGLHCDEVGERCDSSDDAATLARFVLIDAMRGALPAAQGCSVGCEVRDEAGRVVFRGHLAFTSEHPSPAP